MDDFFQWLLTGGLIPLALLLCGGFFLVYLRGKPLSTPRKLFQALRIPSAEGISPFRAVTLALAGTLGVGNIVGVANAILIGGAGAIFWMWISALLAMILKYAEILLAVKHRKNNSDGTHFGGAIYYIRECFSQRKRKKIGFFLSVVFAFLMVLDALSMGCIIQVNAVVSALNGVFGVSALFGGMILLVLTAPIIVRGAKGISALTEYLVPIMSAGYLILSVAVLWIRHDEILPTLSRILTEALSPTGVSGGIIGFLTSRALRVGTMRGLLSNEAGCGTAPTAHASSNTPHPAAQGVWGIAEVFVDTILLCTLTALVILIGNPNIHDFGLSPVMMTVHSYSSVLGKWSEYFFAASIFCFGYATVICWAGYGMESVKALSSKKRYTMLYLFLFCVCIPFGAAVAPNAVWNLADFAIAALTVINLTVLLLMRREIKTETFRFFE